MPRKESKTTRRPPASLATSESFAVLDVDLLASTRTCLTHLVPRLRAGGVIFTQDGHLRAVAALLADASFWRDEVGVAPPTIPGVGHRKFLTIRFDEPAAARDPHPSSD